MTIYSPTSATVLKRRAQKSHNGRNADISHLRSMEAQPQLRCIIATQFDQQLTSWPFTDLMLKPILLVEDNPHDQELALMALTSAGLLNETVMVRDGEEALEYLFRQGMYASRPPGNPAVVLLDLKMPKMDGLEVLAAVRASPETARVPIVMLTGSREEADIARSYEHGVNAFIVKPMEFKELIRAVAEIGAFWAVLNEPPVGSTKYRPPVIDENCKI